MNQEEKQAVRTFWNLMSREETVNDDRSFDGGEWSGPAIEKIQLHREKELLEAVADSYGFTVYDLGKLIDKAMWAEDAFRWNPKRLPECKNCGDLYRFNNLSWHDKGYCSPFCQERRTS